MHRQLPLGRHLVRADTGDNDASVEDVVITVYVLCAPGL